ncbi:MAG TPA: hypothetical protein VK540_13875 [Polyangiaceae bacterium]|nr:hypothetical protein [Polyangiaceae bacterium]
MKNGAAAGLAVLSLLATPLRAEAPPKPESFGPEMIHLPALERQAEQGILRPVPIAVELPDDLNLRARRVLLHYRLWGEPDWTTLQLRSRGARYEGAIPCLEVSTVTGDLKYYIRVHDNEGRVVASAGSRAKPYVVTIKNDWALSAGAKAPARCPDPADCPAGLPGCPSEKVEVVCQTDKDCEGGLTCSWRGVCEKIDRRRDFFLLSVAQDFGLVATSGACSVHAQENEGYACYRSDGGQYIGSPVMTNEPVGVGPGPTRLMVGFEHLFYYDTSVGVRVGWAALGVGPTPRGGTPFFPLSVALRATHWFGSDLFARSGWRPYAFVTGGYGMSDIKARTQVREDPRAQSRQPGNDLEQRLVVWKRAGDGFVGAGGGVAFAFDPRRMLSIEAALLQAFPYGALIVAPTLGGMFAF